MIYIFLKYYMIYIVLKYVLWMVGKILKKMLVSIGLRNEELVIYKYMLI